MDAYSTAARRPGGHGPTPASSVKSEKVERDLFLALTRLPRDDPRTRALRADLVTRFRGLAVTCAMRYRHRGEELEDLIQTAHLGLVKALNGFDPHRGTSFAGYAAPVILGELKLYFRDCTWSVHVPRSMRDLRIKINRAVADLSQCDGERPSLARLAEHLGLDENEVAEGMLAANAYNTVSMDELTEVFDGASPPWIAHHDGRLDLLIDRETVWPLLRDLPKRELTILLLQYYGNRTQSQIAKVLGISQVHVSRLHARACAQIRSQL
jgi:RNA polymerase sigma-B factor